jgi:hypothetical protein
MRSFARSLVAAAAVHGLLALLAARIVVRPVPSPPPSVEVDLEVFAEEEGQATDPASVLSAGAAAAPRAEGHDRARVPRSSTALAAGEVPQAATPQGVPSAQSWSAPIAAPLPLDALGVGRTNPFLVPPPGTTREPDRAREAARRVERSMSQDALAHDRAIGLGPDGPVLTELELATARSTAPVNGRAVFRAEVGSDGAITDIRLVDASEDVRSWEEVARAARVALAGRRMRKVAGARGVAMTIEVVSRWQLPSGHDPGTDVRVAGIPVKRGEGKRSPRVDLLDPIPKITTTPLTIGDTTLLVPTVQIHLTILGTNADPTDVGAAPLRSVHARVLDAKVE